MKSTSALNAAEAVDPDFLALSALEQRVFLLRKERWFGYPLAKHILAELDDLLAYPRYDRPQNVLLYGVPDNGKSFIAKRFLKLHPPILLPNGEASRMPVIYMVAPDSASEPKFYGHLIKATYAPTKLAPVSNMRAQAVRLMKTVKARVLIVDEIQQVLTGGGNRQEAMLNALKTVASEAQVSIVAVGVRKSLSVLMLDPQIASRFDRIELPLWKQGEQFNILLNTFEKSIEEQLPKRSGLGRPAMSKKIYAMTDGALGYVVQLLTAAAVCAVRTGKDRITMDIFESMRWMSPRERTGRALE